MSQHKRNVIQLELPEQIYKALEKIAYIKGTSVELVALEAIRSYVGVAKDIDDHYRFKYEQVVEETRKLIEVALGKGLIKKRVEAERVASSLGKLVTLLRDAYGDIPRELVLEGMSGEELERLSGALRRIVGRSRVGGRELNPITYILGRIEEIRGVAKAFGIDIVEKEGSVKAIKFNNVNLLSMYYGYVARLLRRRIRG